MHPIKSLVGVKLSISIWLFLILFRTPWSLFSTDLFHFAADSHVDHHDIIFDENLENILYY